MTDLRLKDLFTNTLEYKDKEVTIPIIDLIYEIAVKGKDPELLLKFLVFKS